MVPASRFTQYKSGMDSRVTSLVDNLSSFSAMGSVQRSTCLQRTDWIRTATDDQVDQIVENLHSCVDFRTADEEFLNTIFSHLIRRAVSTKRSLAATSQDCVAGLYRRLGSQSEVRHQLLLLLTQSASPADLRCFAQLMAFDPPGSSAAAAAAFSPLFRRKKIDVSALFPTILEGISHVQIAAPILDLANFVTRHDLVDRHPAHDRKTTLIDLLGKIVGRLGRLGDDVCESSESWSTRREMVNDGLALCVSLCDALALIGDSAAIGKLNQAIELEHRRVRVEAAAALARLGEKRGTEELVKLAAEPVARLRVLAYTEELDIVQDVADQYKTEIARSEAELACFLAKPTQFGIAPTHFELIDQREQYWPGYDAPVVCFLFRYTYSLPNSSWSNIGISGPLTHSWNSDMENLSFDDIYAAYAGWQAEHEDIYQIDIHDLHPQQRRHVERLKNRLADEGHDEIRDESLGFFFGEQVLLATACNDGIRGSVVVDQQNVYWYPHASHSRYLTPSDVFAIYKGRKMLRMFNV